MAKIKEELVKLLSHALELEHSARIQYLTHAELIDGLNAEPLISRLKEIAKDEENHETKFRSLLADYLGAEPVMSVAQTHPAKNIQAILRQNLKNEREAVDLYKEILQKIYDHKEDFKYEFETLEHEVRHVIVDEQEHIAELKILLALK